MKKSIACIIVIALALAVFAGCSSQTPRNTVDLGDENAVLFTVEGADVDSMTLGEFLALDQMTVTLSKTNSVGETTTATYQGVHWNTIKQALGIDSYSAITLEASDGYTITHTPDILEDPDSIFAVIQDDEPIESDGDGRMWFCGSENFTANNWCKYVVKITVVP